MSLRDILRKAESVFVEMPDVEKPAETPRAAAAKDGPAPGSPEAIWAEYKRAAPSEEAAPPAPESEPTPHVQYPVPPPIPAAPPQAAAPPPAPSQGALEFASIYRQANVPQTHFTAEQVLDMLAALPQELPLETKRQTVSVTLSAMAKALGSAPDAAQQDATNKLSALAHYVESYTRRTTDIATRAELEIASLQAQIEARRKDAEAARRQQSEVTVLCSTESERLKAVLTFFANDPPHPTSAG